MPGMTDTVRAVLGRIDATTDDRQRARLWQWIETQAQQNVLAYSPERLSGTVCDAVQLSVRAKPIATPPAETFRASIK